MLKNNAPSSGRLKILVRLDANHHVGLAHAVRVAKILSTGKTAFGETWAFDIHVIGDLAQYDVFFGKDIIAHSFSGDVLPEADKAQEVVSTAKEIKADILLVDHPHLTKISWDLFVDSALPVIAIDDEGGPVRADLIFNGTILDDYHNYPHVMIRTKINAGGKYALINPCFRENSWKEPEALSIISVIGSGDRACEWALDITGHDGPLSKLGSVKKAMIVGSAFPQIDQLKENCHIRNITLYQGLNQDIMAELLCNYTMGLITGGMIVYECLASGLPIVIFPQEKNLPPEADYFAKSGCAVDLGYQGGMDMTLVEAEIKNMLDSQGKRLALSQRGKAVIDGKGMSRTIAALNDFFDTMQNNKNTRTDI